jgi:hypothetical protein
MTMLQRLGAKRGCRAQCLGAAVAVALGLNAGAALAGTCLDLARELAQAHKLSIDPPNASIGQAPKTPGAGDLGKSGGVIEPPPVNDPAVIEPRGDVRYGMPTVPDVAPPPRTKKEKEAAAPRRLTPADLALLEATLVAARNEAQRGREQQCFERLEKAQQIAARQGE